jgi:site-specific DNA recombinase
MTDQMLIPAAAYARYSTDRQDARSIDDQIFRCRAYAKEHGLNVVAEFKDAAKSGATLDRADMQKMLAVTRTGRHCPFRVLLVDDLSRLSRDIGNAWRLVFEDLASTNVQVIDCSTGMSSDGAGARLTFGAMALVNDTFLQLVKTETHRGLASRARDGFWPGGRVYGYFTRPEEFPEDPLHVRATLCVQPAEAEVVRRVFRDYDAGVSLGAICDALNNEHIGGPQDGSTKKTAGRGWSRSQLHFMVRNKRYTGEAVWNKRQWFRDPVSKRRRCRLRPEKDWVVTQNDSLAIIDQATWDRVQAKIASRKGSDIRPPGPGKHPHLLSGLLRCGQCGSPMSVVSRTHKAGKSWTNFGCSAHHQKGAAICSNNRTVSELGAGKVILNSLIDFIDSPMFEDWVDQGKREAEAAEAKDKPVDDNVTRLMMTVKAQEAKVERIVSLLLDVGASETLKARLQAEETELRRLRLELKEAKATTQQIPTAHAKREKMVATERVLALVRNLQKVARKAPKSAREVLASVIHPVVLRPRLGGHDADITLRKETAAFAGGRVCDGISCGDRI